MGKKFDRCITKVKKKKGIKSAFAICTASLKKKKRNNL